VLSIIITYHGGQKLLPK
jgi:hypothetical protein